jgi:hypothetical protein
MIFSYISKELLHIILEYYGRIKYKNGKYVNIIHKNDERYNIITPIISKKMEIKQNIELSGSDFYFEFSFDICNSTMNLSERSEDKELFSGVQTKENIGLVYDYNFSYSNKFEICYYDTRNNGLKQIRTYL